MVANVFYGDRISTASRSISWAMMINLAVNPMISGMIITKYSIVLQPVTITKFKKRNNVKNLVVF